MIDVILTAINTVTLCHMSQGEAALPSSFTVEWIGHNAAVDLDK